MPIPLSPEPHTMVLVVEGPDQAERPLVKVAAGEDPPWSEKKWRPLDFFSGKGGQP
jgi:hypothetical protein